MENHASVSKLWDGRTLAWLSYEPRRLIFFVQGFGGENISSWVNFPGLMLNDPHHAHDDLIFFGYESRRQAAKASGGLLFERCEKFLTHPHLFKNSIGHPRDQDFSYEKIVFIGHSLGGAVVRYMILRALQLRSSWMKKAALLFFAPATAGARVERVVRLAVATSSMSFLPRLQIYSRYRWPVIDDLVIGSPFLTDIFDRTQQAAQNGVANILSKGTLFGSNERIIDLTKPNLLFDEPYGWLEDLNHNTVCKPNKNVDEPYLRLADILQAI